MYFEAHSTDGEAADPARNGPSSTTRTSTPSSSVGRSRRPRAPASTWTSMTQSSPSPRAVPTPLTPGRASNSDEYFCLAAVAASLLRMLIFISRRPSRILAASTPHASIPE